MNSAIQEAKRWRLLTGGKITVSTVLCASDSDTRNCDAVKIIEAIRTGGKGKKVKGQVQHIRNRFEAELANTRDLKRAKAAIDSLKKSLPAVLWSGAFNERKNDALVQYSGLLCADLDSLGADLPAIREELKQSPHLWALFTSPSGYGLKAVFRVPPDASQHAGSFRAIREHVRKLTGVEVDQSCKDVARLCFLSYDPDIYYNPGAREIEPLPDPERPARMFNGAVDLSERQRIAEESLGKIDWQSETSGYLLCPGKHLHTTGEGERDCRIDLDNVPTVYCFHNSCRAIIAGVNHELRSRIGKVERASNAAVISVINDKRDVGLQPAPAPYVPPPLTLLPSQLQEYVCAEAESLNVDVSYILLPMLSSLGSAIGNSRSIRLKPGFTQPPVIWTAIVGRSGSRKSPALEAACFAVTEHEQELMQENKQAQETFDENLTDWECKKKTKRGAKPEKPSFLTCLLDDLTIEVLADVLIANPRGVLVRKDELSHWLASFDQYRNVKGSDVSRWLTLHSAFFFGLDRRTDQRHYRIRHPRVCITGGIQPRVLNRALTEDFFERGLPARFLFGFPPMCRDRWSEVTVPETLRQGVIEVSRELWLIPPEKCDGGSRPKLLELTKDAKTVYGAYYDEVGAAAVEADEHESAAWCKLSGYAARLALIGQPVRDPRSEIVTADTMQAACELARWFGNEAVRIYAILAETREQREMRRLVEFIESRGGSVTVRDVITYYRPLRNQKDRAEQMLDQLVKAGLGKWEDVHPAGPGRPTRVFRLLPVSASAQLVSTRGGTANCADADTLKGAQNNIGRIDSNEKTPSGCRRVR